MPVLKAIQSNYSLAAILLFFSAGIMLTSCNGGTSDTSGTTNSGTTEFTVDLPESTLTPAELGTANKVRVHSLGDVQHLNFVTATDNQSTVISGLTHQLLYGLDPKTYEYVPILAKKRATIGKDEQGRVTLDFEIRPEAVWDNGTPITAQDIIFSIKVIFVPDVETVGRLKPYLDYIEDIIVDKENPKKFKVICKRPYMSAETSIANIPTIIPSHLYDEKGILKGYSLKEMLDEKNAKKMAGDAKLKKFAKNFNSDRFKFKEQEGSGPYNLEKWDRNERLVLKKKTNWWGNKVHEQEPNNPFFQAYPEEISFVTIKDLTTAVVALKGQSIDAMQSVPNKQFVQELSRDNKFKGKFAMHTPPLFAYDYIGLNMRDPRLADVKVRKALAHCMNIDQLVNTELYGLGERMINIIHPLFKNRFNDEIKPYGFNPAIAKKLLEEAGWTDSDGNGILDKEIDGELEELDFTIYVNNGNDRRKSAALIFQNGLKQIKVKLNIQILEWSSMLDKIHKKDFEMYVMGWVASAVESDPAQIWHTESYANGSNYVGFGTPETDEVIDNLRQTVDDAKRFEYYKELQQKIHDEVPYIFLVVQKNRVAINRKYGNAYGSGNRSGFHAPGFSTIQE